MYNYEFYDLIHYVGCRVYQDSSYIGRVIISIDPKHPICSSSIGPEHWDQCMNIITQNKNVQMYPGD